ncbi:hypothetical protein GVN20_05585 [Runella sp. CRIBMP]|nr:hypothetical protein [Runella sp. CRIBMP]
MEPINLKLYPTEAMLLREFLIDIGRNALALKAQAPAAHFVLFDWLDKSFGAASIRIEHGSAKSARTVKIPMGVALLLLREMQLVSIHPLLQSVVGGLHKGLVNRGYLLND